MQSKLPPLFPGLPMPGQPPEDLRLVEKVFRRAGEGEQAGAIKSASATALPPVPRAAENTARAYTMASWRSGAKGQAARRGVALHELDLGQLARLLPSNQYANLLSGLDPEHIEAIKQVASQSDTVIAFACRHTQSNFWPQAPHTAVKSGGMPATKNLAGGNSQSEAGADEARSPGHGAGDDVVFGKVLQNINEKVGKLDAAGRGLVHYAQSSRMSGRSDSVEQCFFVFGNGTTLMSTTPEETRAVEHAVRRANYLATRSKL